MSKFKEGEDVIYNTGTIKIKSEIFGVKELNLYPYTVYAIIYKNSGIAKIALENELNKI